MLTAGNAPYKTVPQRNQTIVKGLESNTQVRGLLRGSRERCSPAGVRARRLRRAHAQATRAQQRCWLLLSAQGCCCLRLLCSPACTASCPLPCTPLPCSQVVYMFHELDEAAEKIRDKKLGAADGELPLPPDDASCMRTVLLPPAVAGCVRIVRV